MATQIQGKVTVVSGGHVRFYPEAASQSFKQGEFVYLASGKVTILASDGTTVLGIAGQDATGTTDTMIPVIVADSATIFRGNVYHATIGSAITAVTNVGVKYGIEMDATNHNSYVDIGSTSADAVVIIALDNNEVGDTYGNVEFRVLNAALQTDTAAT